MEMKENGAVFYWYKPDQIIGNYDSSTRVVHYNTGNNLNVAKGELYDFDNVRIGNLNPSDKTEVYN